MSKGKHMQIQGSTFENDIVELDCIPTITVIFGTAFWSTEVEPLRGLPSVRFFSARFDSRMPWAIRSRF